MSEIYILEEDLNKLAKFVMISQTTGYLTEELCATILALLGFYMVNRRESDAE